MKKYIIALVTLMLGASCFAQDMFEKGFKSSDEDFINPERGFVSQFGDREMNAFTAKTLAGQRDKLESMIWRQFDLRKFKTTEISQEYLDMVKRDFDMVRAAGLKIIPRFSYCSRIGDSDASLEMVMKHLDQLEPILKENSDIIAVMHCGFIGAWGEMHSSTNGLTEPEPFKAIVNRLLAILPMERTIQIRYPSSKADLFNGRKTPMTYEEAFSGRPYSRIAHHNDCFLASPTDVGTYRTDIEAEKDFLNVETAYTPMGGETCNPRNDYPILRKKTLAEMERMHWSYLNSRYSRKIIDQWIADGYYHEVSTRLGYRLELGDGEFQKESTPGSSFTFSLSVSNVGFGPVYNPRMCELIIKEKKTGEQYKALLPEDPRFWLAGTEHSFTYSIVLPEEMSYGEYEIFLNLADPCEKLYTRPEYSVRLANSDVTFTKEGYNDLGVSVKIVDKPSDKHNSFLKFKKF